MSVPLSILDLATIDDGEPVRAALDATVAMARRAEELGYRRVWYAEHHNMARIASSATSVLIAHVAAHTKRIRVGSGGIMLPNHSPLTIAEQFGTLETLHPGRIDLGLGRAPGSDQDTMRALRRDAHAADGFLQDVQELHGYLAGSSRIPGVDAVPGKGTNVPLYILGSSLFGAQLAAALGLPYANASHFSPDSLHEAVSLYRSTFVPSEQLDRPYVIAGLNVIAADTDAVAQEQLLAVQRLRASWLLNPGRPYFEAEADRILQSFQGRQLLHMMKYSAVGTSSDVAEYVDGFAKHADADELIVVHNGTTASVRLRSLELLAEGCGLALG
jgi:luciferase family oxidoreductase group 1